MKDTIGRSNSLLKQPISYGWKESLEMVGNMARSLIKRKKSTVA